MKYQAKKFSIRKKELLGSKVFNLHNGNFSYGFPNNENVPEQNDAEWKKKLKIKENILSLHFKEALSNYKPKILLWID